MIRIIILLLILVPNISLGIDAFFNHSKFYNPEQGTYVELQMLFNASSVKYMEAANGYQSIIELTYIFEQEGKVVNYSKNLVKSPYTNDSVTLVDFMDVQRFYIAPGNYDLAINLRDINNPKDTGTIVQVIEVPTPGNMAFFSDAVFMDTVFASGGESSIYTRGNLEMVPKISGFQGPDRKSMGVYAELYQTDMVLSPNEPLLITADIVDLKVNSLIESYHWMQRSTSNAVIPVYKQWNIDDLYSGNYLMRIEARNRLNESIALLEVPFQRYNTLPDTLTPEYLNKTFVQRFHEDSLRDMTYCLKHRASVYEEKFIEENWDEGDTLELQRFFYEYWNARNPLDPEAEWKQYHKKIRHVERNYDVVRRHACTSDRGRIYLMFGKPNTLVNQPAEPNALPYQIWHYYKIPEKSNAKFVFYDSDGMDEYVMLHSNVPGEANDYLWYMRLNESNQSPSGLDIHKTSSFDEVDNMGQMNNDPNRVGARALDYWNNPR